jgi:glycosyltransferase involved in cell wall biosynthesis
MNKKISVLMAVYNQNPTFLQEAIESVLAQTCADFELLLIDDGSTKEGCKSMLANFAKKDERVRLIENEKNLGIIKSRNHGLEAALGEYVAILDSDDMASHDRLEKQLNFMQANPEIALCGSWAKIIDEQGNTLGNKKTVTESLEIKRNIIKYNFFTHSSCFFKKSILTEIGFYDEEAKKVEDYDFLLRVIGKFKVAIIPEYLCSYRINTKGDSLSDNKLQEKNALKARFKAIKEHAYPKSDYLKIVRPILMYLFLPTFLKQKLLNLLWAKDRS